MGLPPWPDFAESTTRRPPIATIPLFANLVGFIAI